MIGSTVPTNIPIKNQLRYKMPEAVKPGEIRHELTRVNRNENLTVVV
jgi:hypothetical protein